MVIKKQLILFIFSFFAINASEKPNIIYILADDLGYGDLGCYGQEIIKTPNIDKLASEGMKFTQHYAGSTVCGPSRSVMLTGRHTGHTYLRGNGFLKMRPDPLDMIFPRALQKVGYHTATIGKSGLACNSDDGSFPATKGFDSFFGFTAHYRAHWYFPNYLWKNGKKQNYPNNTLHDGDKYSSDLVMDETLNFLDKQKDGPFFLHVAFQIPHASLRAKEEWKAKYRPILKEKLLPPKEHGHYSYEREPKTTFAAMVSYMDHNVGLIIAKLKELGLDKNTLVMFSSDNGAMQEGGHKRSSFNSNADLRGGKRDLYEGGVRVPTIAWWPGKIKAGTTTDHLSGFWDISPTMRELAGAEAQADTDGISLLPTLFAKGTQEKHDYLYWEFHEEGGKRAVRQGKWKLIHLGIGKKLKPRIELYDLSNDPHEKNNLAKTHPDRVSELSQIFKKAHVKSIKPEFQFAEELNQKQLAKRLHGNKKSH
ncbi:arylsulfatase [Lentisphaera profundi]|uniref:Arylsulfatase n=1 Tax=Lentisphaera profundi TaxID=1658616 RepID=A0ABY7VTN9_9BACT|nr:arylsulfatase [Lentisphaera profundi]WDE97563.1 arylsulfatase [Lentisphaera profundi]